MQIDIIDRTLPTFYSDGWIRKRIPLFIEQVLPDSNADLKQIVWVDSWLQLTGKQLGSDSGASSGSVHASVIYLTEDGHIASLTLQKGFTFDFTVDLPDEQTLPQIRWAVTRTEARVVNSRKLAVDLEILAEARVFRTGELITESVLPEGDLRGLYVLHDEIEARRAFAVTEKPFTVREQLRFPGEIRSLPERISETPRAEVQGIEQLGNKAIVKGQLVVHEWILDEGGLPRSVELRAPFSQLLDIDDVSVAQSSSEVMLCSWSTELIETIDGGFALDVEAHAVLQFAAWTEQVIRYIRDAYCTRSECTCSHCQRRVLIRADVGRSSFDQEVSVSAPEDLAELLQTHVELGMPETGEEGISIPGSVDLLYRTASGEIDIARRNLTMTAGPIMSTGITAPELHTTTAQVQGKNISVHISGALRWEAFQEEGSSPIDRLDIGEEQDPNMQTPAIYLVRSNGEDVWTLAKRYRSSVDAIREANETGRNVLLIPSEG